jgi:hypothetical protein
MARRGGHWLDGGRVDRAARTRQDFLLRLFESRVGTPMSGSLPQMLYLPYVGLSMTDLCLWVHGLMGRSIDLPTGEGSASAALGALCGLASSGHYPFILLLDDADSMPQETLRMLAEGLPARRSPLRLLMALGSVHRLSASVFEVCTTDLPSALDEKDKRENWMAQPIEDDF